MLRTFDSQEPAHPGRKRTSDVAGTLVDGELKAIRDALRRFKERLAQAAKAAKALGIPRSSLYVKLKKYGRRSG